MPLKSMSILPSFVILVFSLILLSCQDPESAPRERTIYGEPAPVAADQEAQEEEEQNNEETPTVEPNEPVDEGAEEDPAEAEALQLINSNCVGCHAPADLLDNPNSIARLQLPAGDLGIMPPEPNGLADEQRQSLINYLQARQAG
ncbi:MAG: c-type cytochrome [Oligoflexus sp.]